MGCAQSSTSRKVEASNSSKSQNNSLVYTYVDDHSPEAVFKFIIDELRRYSCSCGMVPSVCLCEKSFPLITAKLSLVEGDQNDIELPVLSAAFAGKGRVICFPHIGIFEELSSLPNVRAMFQRSLLWLSGQNSTMTPVLLLNFPKEITSVTTKTLQIFGMFVESSNRASDLSNHKIVCAPSTYADENNNDLEKFVLEGGGLAVFFSPADAENPLSYPINALLSKLGLSYTFCSISERDMPFDISNDYNVVKNHHFLYYSSEMKELLSEENDEKTSQDKLDMIVTKLRYHIAVCGESQTDCLIKLAQICWDYLYRTQMFKDKLCCWNMKQRIIILLVCEMLPKFPPETFVPFPEVEIFPGVCEETNYEADDITLTLTIYEESWISTGFYLPTGVVGTVEAEDDGSISDVHFQIGAHHESLFQKSSPWKRWPTIILPFEMKKGKTKLGSPFGGPIYVAASEDLEGSVTLKLTFNHFLKYPRWCYNDPSVWEDTKDKKVPIGEIECENVIFTLTSGYMKQIDFELLNKAMKTITSTISSFMSYQIEKPFRVVFDIELLEDEPICGYPIVYELKDIEPMIKDIQKPSVKLFDLSNLIAILMIREGCFDSTIEEAFASIASSMAFSQIYPDFDPLNFEGVELPPLFAELWEINSSFGSTILQKTLKKFQDPSYELLGVPEDTWIDFVREMCRIGQRDFTQILERSRPVPLNVSMSCHNFPVYNPEKPVNDSPLVDQK